MTADPVYCRISNDTAALLEQLAEDVFDAPIDPARVAVFLAQPNHILFVASVEGLVVGQSLGIIEYAVDRPPSLFLENLGVAPAFRRRGIARRLLELTCDAANKAGADALWLGADPESETAEPFYRALGMAFTMHPLTEVSLPLELRKK